MTNRSIEISPEDFAKTHSNLVRLLRYIRRRHIILYHYQQTLYRVLVTDQSIGAIFTLDHIYCI